MRLKNKLFCLIIMLFLVLTPVTVLATEQTIPPVEAEADLAGLSWYVQDDCLYITGSGAMADYSSASAAPWASYRNTATNIFMDDGITSIGNNAFSGFQKLTYVVIPDSVTRVGKAAFKDCPRLSDVFYCPTYSGVIESEAFSGCTYLTYLELGGNLTEIGSKAFFGCTDIGMVGLPDELLTVGDQAFESCTGMQSLLIPGNVAHLGSRAFAGCSGLKHVFFTGDAPSLSTDTFATISAPVAPYVSIPGNNDTWTEDIIFNYLSFSILSRTDENEVASGRCGDLFWFLDTDGYLVVYGEGEMADYTSHTQVPWAVFFDDIHIAYLDEGATSVSPYAFFQCPNLTTARLPDSLYRIGTCAFYNCGNLFWVYNSQLEQALPNSLVQIDEAAFSGCCNLSVLSFGPNLVSMGSLAFFGCSLQTVRLPDSLTSIALWAFGSNYNLTSVSFPGGPLEIGDGAFTNCTRLSDITFRGSAPQISSDAFYSDYDVPGEIIACYPEGDPSWNRQTMVDYGRPITWMPIPANLLGAGRCGENLIWTLDREGTMTISGTGDMYDYVAGLVFGDGEVTFAPWETLRESITSVVIEEGVTSIGKSAFYKCYNLEEVSLPESLTKISADAFFDCDNVPYFDIGKNVSEIQDYAFHSCDYTAAIWVHPDNAYYASDDRGVLFNRSMTLLIRAPGGIGGIYTIPYGVTEIYRSAFDYCAQLEGITIPSTVTTICQSAFSSCNSLTYIDIPASVTTIDRCAFWCSSNLAEIRFRGDAPTFGEDGIFTLVEAYVYYPEGNATWTEDKRQQYEGTLTWIPEEPEEPGYCVPGLNNAKFYTIEEAMAAYDPETQYIKLLKDNSIYTWLEKDLRIDLNGFSLHGELDPEGFRIYGIDTATDSYTAENFGTFRCYDSYGQRVTPERQLKTDKNIYGATKRYLAVEGENGWSFHRFYMGVSHITFNPTHSGIGYRATFAGDPWVKSQLAADSGYGIQLSLDADFENSVEATFPATTFPADGTAQRRSALLENILTPDMPLSQQKTNGNAIVYVRVFLTLSDGSRICTGRTGISMSLLLRNIGGSYKNYTAAQQLRLRAFLRTYPELCKEWNFLQNVA